MSGIYPLDSEKNLILYPSQNTLYLRTTLGENFTRPVTLCTDYAKSLSDTIYNSTVYYAYQNTSGDIIVRSITDLQELYRISSAESPDCQNPLLLSFQGALLLFYVIQNPIGNNFYIKALCPFQPEKHIAVTDQSFSDCPAILALPSNQEILIHAFTDNMQCIFLMDSNLHCYNINLADGNADKIDRALAEQEKNAILKNAEQNTLQLKKELQERDAIIESVKRQYTELMETASRYKAEAEKWHDLAYKKDARPVPGERLLIDEW